MSTSTYLLHVNSRPTVVSGSIWTEWYTTEHLPDLVNSKASTCATFYSEIPVQISTTYTADSNPRHFLALYQTDHEEPLKSEECLSEVRKDGSLFEQASGKAKNQDNGEFDARNCKLIQDFDPEGLGDATSTFIVIVEMEPPNMDDFHKWYHEEHLDLLSKIPWYRKTSRYVLGPATPLMFGKPGKYLAIHELDSLGWLAGPEAKAANGTEWTVRMLKESSVFIVRMWKLVHGEGDWE